MEHARPPSELNMDAAGGPVGRADAWKKWKQQFLLFVKASGVHTEPSSVQASLLVNLIGPDGFDVYQTLTFDKEEDRDDVNVLLKKFDSLFGTKSNVTLMRYKFFTRNQEDGESIQQYVTALRLLSKKCEFSTLEEDLIKDRIVCGIRQATVRDRLLRCEELNLDKAMKICQAVEASRESELQMASTSGIVEGTAHVDSVAFRGRARGRGARAWAQRAPPASSVSGGAAAAASGGRGRGRSASSSGGAGRAQPFRAQALCAACGSARCAGGDECPARRVSCFTCGNRGHFARNCKLNHSYNNSGRSRVDRVYEVECDEGECYSESEDDSFYISTIGVADRKSGSEDWFQELSCVNGTENFKLDTGADYNIMSYRRFCELGFSDDSIIKKKVPLLSYTHDVIPLKGICIIPWSYKNIVYKLKFAIADMECSSVLGQKSCEFLGLVKRVRAVEMSNYDDLFKGLGCLPGKYHIVIDRSVPPVICASRKIPHGLRDRLGEELGKMEQLGVIRKVTHPTQWVHPLVLVAKKNNGIRICLDPRELNRAVQRAHFQLPTVSELASRLHGARFFSVLDANSGFWTVELDEESADLCTFSTPFGRFQFLRLPFGINCASEVFHGKLRQLLEGLEGVENYIDDVVVWGETRQIHDTRLKALLDRARKINLKFNKEKCKIGVQEVKYLGHVFDSNGMRPDYEKIKAIKELKSPKDRKEVERFLGAVNYLSKFIPHYSEIAIPLTSLLRKGSEWRWESSESEAFDRLKEAVTGAGVLALYEPARPVVLSVDASRDALGAVLLQAGRPVEYASRTLTDAQKRYAQVEKEMLAIVFACERFHQYVYGQKGVVVESDHKPLESIFKKPLISVPARLQRMLLRIQGYDLIVTYVPGKYMYIADMLSRAALPDLYSDEVHNNVVYQVQMMVGNVPMSNDKLTLIKKETKRDTELQMLAKYINSGWPDHKYNVSNEVKFYWSIKEELLVVDDVIFRDSLVLIPKNARNDMLRIIHEGHLGIDRCKRRARQVMFWPNMSRDIELYVKRCHTCQEHSNAPAKQPMIPIEIPELPWFKIGSDLFEFKKQHYLILVDYYSNFVEVCKLGSLTSNAVIQSMKNIFSRHGIPNVLISDNGTQYSSREFKCFANAWGFNHVTSSPNYAQSNGKSERAVQTVKKILKKSIQSNGDFELALLSYRNTPRDGLSSPAQLLMGRRLRCQLPVHPNILKPQPIDPSEHLAMLNKQRNVKMYYDQRCKSLSSLQEGDSVVCIDGKARSRGKVVGHASTPRSYIVQTSAGGRYRRNRRHLIKCEPDLKSPNTSVSNEEEFCDAHEDVDIKNTDPNEYQNNNADSDSGHEVHSIPTSPPLTRKAKKIAAQRIAKNLN